MKQFVFAAILAISQHCLAQEVDVNVLLTQEEQPTQEQLDRVCTALQQPGVDPRSNVAAFQEVQALKDINPNEDALMRQVAIFAAKEGEGQPLFARMILELLDPSPKLVIQALAPYLNADNKNLRSFVRDWFQAHDNAGSDISPLEEVNYEDYLNYVRVKQNVKEDIPEAFIEYIYERHPSKALLLFAYADPRDLVERLQAIRAQLETHQKEPEIIDRRGLPPMPAAKEEKPEDRIRRLQAKPDRQEIILAEHIISNAIWFNENGFADRSQQALSEAKEQQAKLAEHDQWWARLYVAEIMRRHQELRDDDILEKLADDTNALVSKTAKAAQGKAAAAGRR